MPTLPKLKKAKSRQAKHKGSAIDSAQRELLEKQGEIEAQIKALQASLEAATMPPARQTHSDTVRRGRYVIPSSVTGGRQVTVVPAEPRRRTVPKRPTMLRAERTAARHQTMALIVCLAGAIIYAFAHRETMLYALSHLLP